MSVTKESGLMRYLMEADGPPKPSHGTLRYFVEILGIAMAAMRSDCDTVDHVDYWARNLEKWLRQVLTLKNGVPSEEAYPRIFRALSPKQFEVAPRRWVSEVVDALNGRVGSVARRCVGQAVAVRRPFTWSLSSLRNLASFSGKKKSLSRVTRSSPRGNFSRYCIARAYWSPSMPWGASRTLLVRTPTRTVTTSSRSEAITRRCWKPSRLISSTNIKRRRSTVTAKSTSPVVGSPATSPRSALRREALTWPIGTNATRSVSSTPCARSAMKSRTSSGAITSSSRKPTAEQLAVVVRAYWGADNRLHWFINVSFCEDPSILRKNNAHSASRT